MNLPATSNPMSDFAERLRKSLRDDIATMMPDDVLAGMIQKVIDEEFFIGRVERHSHGGGETRHPPKFHTLIIDALTPLLQAKANEIARELAPKFDAELAHIFRDGASKILLSMIDSVFQHAFASMGSNANFAFAVENVMRNRGWGR